MRNFTSRFQRVSNQQLKELKEHSRRKSPFHDNSLLVEGHRMIIDALQAKLIPKTIYLSENGQKSPLGETLRGLCYNISDQVYSLDHNTLSKFSSVENSQGALAIFEKPRVDTEAIKHQLFQSSAPLIILCDRVSDPGNLGSIIRSGYSFGVDLLIAVETCDLWVRLIPLPSSHPYSSLSSHCFLVSKSAKKLHGVQYALSLSLNTMVKSPHPSLFILHEEYNNKRAIPSLDH
jgi:hypothetical protein